MPALEELLYKDLKKHLALRHLPTDGSKPALQDRLRDALIAEGEEDPYGVEFEEETPQWMIQLQQQFRTLHEQFIQNLVSCRLEVSAGVKEVQRPCEPEIDRSEEHWNKTSVDVTVKTQTVHAEIDALETTTAVVREETVAVRHETGVLVIDQPEEFVDGDIVDACANGSDLLLFRQSEVSLRREVNRSGTTEICVSTGLVMDDAPSMVLDVHDSCSQDLVVLDSQSAGIRQSQCGQSLLTPVELTHEVLRHKRKLFAGRKELAGELCHGHVTDLSADLGERLGSADGNKRTCKRGRVLAVCELIAGEANEGEDKAAAVLSTVDEEVGEKWTETVSKSVVSENGTPCVEGVDGDNETYGEVDVFCATEETRKLDWRTSLWAYRLGHDLPLNSLTSCGIDYAPKDA